MAHEKPDRIAQILASLETRDIHGGYYPGAVIEPEDRLRWNQARLLALAVYHGHGPSTLPGEYSQERYMLAGSIYRQSRAQFPTGTLGDLESDLAAAVESGWL